MSALYSESTLAIGFPGEEQGVVLSCVEVEIKPVHYYEGKNRSPVLGFGEVEMKGFLWREGVGRIEVALQIKSDNHNLFSALSYDNTHVEITVAKKEAQ